MTPNYDFRVQTNYMLFLFFVFSLLYLYYVINIIKKLELLFLIFKIWLKIELGHAENWISASRQFLKLKYLQNMLHQHLVIIEAFSKDNQNAESVKKSLTSLKSWLIIDLNASKNQQSVKNVVIFSFPFRIRQGCLAQSKGLRNSLCTECWHRKTSSLNWFP